MIGASQEKNEYKECSVWRLVKWIRLEEPGCSLGPNQLMKGSVMKDGSREGTGKDPP